VSKTALIEESAKEREEVVDQLINKQTKRFEERKASQLPEPTGYRLLIALPPPDEKTDGGLVKAAETLHNEVIGSILGLVLKVGPDAYADEARFPNGPYCKKGDLVMFRAFSGTRFKIHGKEFRLINDDSVEATVEDGRGIVKV
jgi:co-chaperonin GroES (HSP10)